MKVLMERIASGNVSYEIADALISENKITVELDADETIEGDIAIVGKNSMDIKGIGYSSDSHFVFRYNQFNGIKNRLHYIINGKNLVPNKVCIGKINIITTAGEFEIPFEIKVKEREIVTEIGVLKTLEDFVEYVRTNYDEALILFISKDFSEYFLKGDNHGIALYKQLMRNANRDVALEEFMVAMGLKEPVKISLKSETKEYENLTDNYGDTLIITRNTWGYAEIDVELEGEFFYNCKERITSEQFNGKIMEYSYYLNTAKLHCGMNEGKIIFKTAGGKEEYKVVVKNPKNDNSDYIKLRTTDGFLIKNYLKFRTGNITGRKWIDDAADIAEQRLTVDNSDITGNLLKAQVAILNNNKELAKLALDESAKYIQDSNPKNVIAYCYYLYLAALYKNEYDFTNEAKKKIEQYYEGGHDNWQILWILFNMDSRYDENPSLKYTLIKRMFNKGCTSPVMYYEAAKIINKQPELLRVMNRFEIQVLNFAGKYSMVKVELAKQAADLMNSERSFKPLYIDILSRIYKETKDNEVLTSICSEIINSGKISNEYFKWLREGVRKELKITNLYEYYIYSIDTNSYEPLEKTAYKYFSYGTDTLVYNKDYFYANMLENLGKNDELYPKYKAGLEKYVTEQLLKGNNNIHLKKIYSYILDDEFLDGNLDEYMPGIMNTYRMKVNNQDITNVIVSHKEVESIQSMPLTDGEAYITLYTKEPVIVFINHSGKVLADVDYTMEKMEVTAPLTKTGNNLMTMLCQLEDVMDSPEKYVGQVVQLKEIEESDTLTVEFKNYLKEFIVDYYYKEFDKGQFDDYILEFDMEELSMASRNKLLEILIKKELWEKVMPYLDKYGYLSINEGLLEKVCRHYVAEQHYSENELLTEICGYVFEKGCTDEAVLKYMAKYYNSGTENLYKLYTQMKAMNITDNEFVEKLLVHVIFEGQVNDRLYELYKEYIKGVTRTVIRKAFYSYVTYNYFVKKIQCPDSVWEILEQEYFNGLATPVIVKIAFVEKMSSKTNITERQIKICEGLIKSLVKDKIIFQFYKKFNRWFKIPFDLIDKTIIDYRTNPKHRVNIVYTINKNGGEQVENTEEMNSIYPGIFTKNIIMFYGEKITYKILEYSDEYPYGKEVATDSICISEKNTYNDESRFGMINSMMICRKIGREDAAREMMQSYQLCKEAGREIFKLL